MSKSAESSPRGRRFGLRFKFSLFVSVAFAFIGVVYGVFFSARLAESMEDQFEQRGRTFVRALARNSWVYLLAGDADNLKTLLEGSLEESDVVAASIRDARSTVAPVRIERIPGLLPPEEEGASHPDTLSSRQFEHGDGAYLAFRMPVRSFGGASPEGGAGEDDPFDVFPGEATKPEESEPRIIGGLVVVFALDAMEQRIEEVQRTAFQITGVTVGGGILLVILLSRIFVTPIERIAATARRIAEGDLEARVDVRTSDELGDLGDAFNSMTATLADREDELREMNVSLEQKVRDRTRALEKKQRELIAANVELERANKMKSEFLANMSHELRTPLNAVNGFSELLLEQKFGPLNDKQIRYARNIHQSGRHLLQLINDILDLSKIEAGRMTARKERFSLRQTVESAASIVQPLAEKKGLRVHVHFDDRVDSVVLDAGKTRQVLYNLMSNAVKFTDEGSITITAEPEGDSGIRIVVADTGIGIQPEDQERIFKEFEQVDGSHARRYEGTGLGLALTQKLIVLQGGRIEVESEAGVGSRFIVHLPREVPTEPT